MQAPTSGCNIIPAELLRLTKEYYMSDIRSFAANNATKIYHALACVRPTVHRAHELETDVVPTSYHLIRRGWCYAQPPEMVLLEQERGT